MERIKKLCYEQPLICIICVLAVISCFAILSATPMISNKVGNPETLWLKQGAFYIISAVMVFIIYIIGKDQIYDKIWIIYWILMVLLIILAIEHFIYTRLWPGHHIIPLVNTSGGATSWFNFPFLSLQPSEFMKIAIVIALARVTKEHNDYYLIHTTESELQYIWKCMKVVVPPALLVLLQNDTGVVLIILVGAAFVIFSSGLRNQWFIFGLSLVAVILIIGAYLFIYQPEIFEKLLSSHQVDRFYGWLDPEGTYNKEGFQLNVLDLLAHDEEELNAYQKVYKEWKLAQSELEQLKERMTRDKADEDYVRFQWEQLDEAHLVAGEQEELEQEAETLSHAEDIKAGLYRVVQVLSSDEGGLLTGLKECCNVMTGLQQVYPGAEELAVRLESSYVELKDISQEVSGREESIEFNPERLAEINERLNQIYTLQQKHRVSTVAELITLRDEYASRLAAITSSDDDWEVLKQRCEHLYVEVCRHADSLTEARKRAAQEVELQMATRLIPLGMPNVRFVVDMGRRKEPGVHGMNTVNFLFSANKNGTLQNISSVASGGEIARVMLSVKAMIAGAVKLPTIVFDEIDTGVSGEIADRMADIMQEMADNERQVISITHLPQIAARGHTHYKVYKKDNETETNSHIRRLTDAERVEEIAHMLSGATLTEAALNNARALLGKK